MDLKFIGSRDNVYQGTRNDLMINPATKDITTISGKDYVKQKIVKVVLTAVNSDISFPTYGTEINDQVFKNVNDPAVQQTIISTLVNALNYIEAQETSTQDDEHISSIDSIELTAIPEQAAAYIKVDVTLRSGQALTLAVGS